MRRNIEARTVRGFVRRKSKIDARPSYQRGLVWSLSQKQLLIDSILRDLDVPKFYLREVDRAPFLEEVIDGQQRLNAIWQFCADEFPLARDADPVGAEAIAGRRYSDLSEDLKDSIDEYELSVVILREAADDDVEEMFLRLQNGTSLNAAEKRNAMPGKMKEFVKSLAEHPFFLSCGFTNSRNAYDHVAAQMVLPSLRGAICNIKNSDLDKLYREYVDFEESSSAARRIKKALDLMHACFPTKTPELKKFNAISLYLLLSQLTEQFVLKGREQEINKWFLDFEGRRRADEPLPVDQRDPELVSYQERTSHATDSADSLRYRNEVLLRSLHGALPDLALRDSQRVFTEGQRLAIFRRDSGVCQVRMKCGGDAVKWEAWHADHRLPWSQGGETSVANGQVACIPCNLAKSDLAPGTNVTAAGAGA